MDSTTKPPPALDLDNLQAIKLLGKGAMGTVFLAHNNLFDFFALKVVDKSSLHHSLRRAHHEISILSLLQAHPFLPSLLGSSENDDFICWAMPFCPGGDLNVLRHRQADHVFSPAIIRFYLAEIVCALEHLHRQGIVYRDLKPENILVQQSGHVTLTDFDLSRILTPRKLKSSSVQFFSDHEEEPPVKRKSFSINKKGLKKPKSARVSPVSRRNPIEFSNNERSNSFVGTEEYMAPEIITGAGHDFAVDWWALGVLCYEMLYGKTPFKGRNRKETFQKILTVQPEFAGKPDSLTDLIRKLLEKEPIRRLGYRRGASEIKDHEFFRGLKWDLLTEVSRPPFLPSGDDTEITEKIRKGGIDITEYFHKLKVPPSPSRSPSFEEDEQSVSLTEF